MGPCSGYAYREGETMRTMNSCVLAALCVMGIAVDVMASPAFVLEDEDLHTALERMLAHATREIVVLDSAGTISGFLDESEIQLAYHDVTSKARTRSIFTPGPRQR